jgi:hypothetical protein
MSAHAKYCNCALCGVELSSQTLADHPHFQIYWLASDVRGHFRPACFHCKMLTPKGAIIPVSHRPAQERVGHAAA